jgi:hypothetical protein
MGAQSHAHRIKISVDVSEEERTYIKMLSAKKHMTISELLLGPVRKAMPISR